MSHRISRREALGVGLAGGLLAPIAGISAAARARQVDQHPPLAGPRINFVQFEKVLDQLGLDGLVLSSGVNVQYVTGVRPVITRMGLPPSAFAVVCRNEKRRLAVACAAFTYYYTMADVQASSPIPIFMYSQSATALKQDDLSGLGMFEDRGEAPVEALEAKRISATRRAAEEAGVFDTPAKSLTAALDWLGLKNSRLGVDDPATARLIAEAAPEATVVGADDALRRIRPVKSDVEIELMRQSAAANAEAALEAAQTIRAGGGYRDLRATFFAAAARRGHRGVFMVVDRVSDDMYESDFREGQSLLIDCVSEYQGYHGDYGRTVFVGEPRASMRRVTTVLGQAWDQVREALRPGLSFDDIRGLGNDALRGLGVSYRVPFSPHSVGLYHSDHVGQTGLAPLPMVLEPGMVISVDCPLLESGVGGSAHLEDLVLITSDGAELLNDPGNQVIIV